MSSKNLVLSRAEIWAYENLYQMKPVIKILLKGVQENAADITYFYGVPTQAMVGYFTRALDKIGEKAIAQMIADFTKSSMKTKDFKQWARNNRCDEYANHVYAPFLQELFKYFNTKMAKQLQPHLTTSQLDAFKLWGPIRVIIKCLGRAVKPEVSKHDQVTSKNQNQQNEVVVFRNRCFAARKQTAWKTALLLFVEEHIHDSPEVVKSVENYRDYLVRRERQLERILRGGSSVKRQGVQIGNEKEEKEEETNEEEIDIFRDLKLIYTGGDSHTTSVSESGRSLNMGQDSPPGMLFDTPLSSNFLGNLDGEPFGSLSNSDSRRELRKLLDDVPSIPDTLHLEDTPDMPLSFEPASQARNIPYTQNPYGAARNVPMYDMPIPATLDQFINNCSILQQEMAQMREYRGRGRQMMRPRSYHGEY